MSEIEDVFNVLWYGVGSWLMLLLFVAILLVIAIKWKYASALLTPIALFIGLDYLSNNLTWHALTMFMTSIFMLAYLAKDAKST